MQSKQLEDLKESLLKERRTMTITQWIRMKDNPVQRNTVEHAKYALEHHLSESSITHYEVAAAETADGKLFKLDGHTRAHLWKTRKLDRMLDNVSVTVYKVKTIEDVKNLYLEFDNQNAVESAKDKFYGACHSQGFYPKSNLLRVGGMTTALGLWVYPTRNDAVKLPIHRTIAPFIEAVKMIDALDANVPRNPAGICAAMLITFAQDGNKARVFWRRYMDDKGIRTDEGRDGVEALLYFMQRRMDMEGGRGRHEICARALTCYEYYQRGIHFKNMPKAMNLIPYRKWANDLLRENGIDIPFDPDHFLKSDVQRKIWRESKRQETARQRVMAV